MMKNSDSFYNITVLPSSRNVPAAP